MKYKNIGLMLHNFGHSFCSGMNMLINCSQVISVELYNLISMGRHEYILINFNTSETDPGILSDELFISIKKV